MGRESTIEFIATAINTAGGKVVGAPNPREAPFDFELQNSSGETLSIVCYAFTANEYRQRGRPAGEHRFQVKYGSDFKNPHELWFAEDGSAITLMFGAHEDAGLFIAVDPLMHNPTWFSSSVEFKVGELNQAKKTGWHGWERDRVAKGRRQVGAETDARTEVVLAFKPEHFLTYVSFERAASGLDPGERLLLLEKIGASLAAGSSVAELLEPLPETAAKGKPEHPLLDLWGLSSADLLEMIQGRFRLAAAVRGGVAEFHLEKLLNSVLGKENVKRIDEDGQPDFQVKWGSRWIRIECKNVLRKLSGNLPRVDFQKSRASKTEGSRFYSRDQFDILAACIHPVTERWEFRFWPVADLAEHSEYKGKLSPYVSVAEEWYTDVREVLKKVSNQSG